MQVKSLLSTADLRCIQCHFNSWTLDAPKVSCRKQGFGRRLTIPRLKVMLEQVAVSSFIANDWLEVVDDALSLPHFSLCPGKCVNGISNGVFALQQQRSLMERNNLYRASRIIWHQIIWQSQSRNMMVFGYQEGSSSESMTNGQYDTLQSPEVSY